MPTTPVPMDLVAIPQGGCTDDGSRVWFQFDTQHNGSFQFVCSHVAVTEILECLLGFADVARRQRRESDTDYQKVPFGQQMAKARTLTHAETGVTPDGKNIILKLKCGPLIQHSIRAPIEEYKRFLREGLLAVEQAEKLTARPSGPAN